MKNTETGFGGLQLLLVVAMICIASLAAVSKYQAFAVEAKITEALNLANLSKRKISENFMLTSSFPRNANEANDMVSTTVSKPEFVRDMRIEHSTSGETVTIKVFLNEGVVENPRGEEQYLFVTGSKSHGGEYAIEWRCGASGFDLELLPEDCQS